MATHDIVEISDYLSVMVKDSLNVSKFQQITDDILKVCQAKKIHKVIIDVTDAGGPFSEDDKFEFAAYASATLKNDVKKYAYIYPKEHISYASQVVSQGSGFNVRAFTSLDDALSWIDD